MRIGGGGGGGRDGNTGGRVVEMITEEGGAVEMITDGVEWRKRFLQSGVELYLCESSRQMHD